MTLNYVVIGGFPVSAWLWHVAVHHAVKLQDGAFREGHFLTALVNQVKDIAIAGDLLF